ncbi:hypothetical protein K505DRAFT_223419, partial [Melanomma pulvis-pyrius CBS 109.77]
LLDDIDLTWADVPILACSLVSGLVDSVAFNAGSVFVSMQTGNTIFLALGAAGLPAGQPGIWLRALVSLCAFWLGCCFFSSTRHFHPKRKATLSISFLLQASLIFISAALAQTNIAPAFGYTQLDPASKHDNAQKQADEGHWAVQLIIALLAFQSSGQIVLSRTLGFNEIPTNVVTSLYCDLLSDQKLFAPLTANVKRNRRVVAVVLLFGGGIGGGWLQHSNAGKASVLWIAGSLKMVIALAWLVWKGKE